MPSQRDYLSALAEIPAKHRAWLELRPDESDNAFPLFAYYGWGVMLNSAQEEAAADLFRKWPAGSIHVWRFANRLGKTTDLMLMHAFAIWLKWRYENTSFDDWLAYRYQTLHSAPLNRLMGKAWGILDAMIAGVADQQKDLRTNTQRPALLAPFYQAGKSQAKDGSDELWLRCNLNNAKVDFLSTQSGAGRIEGDTWWLISWDEFPRQQPITDVPLLVDQTFLPRTSDHMAPLVLSGTATEDSEPVYAEIEEMAERNPRDWNFLTKDRRSNFSQSRASIERQIRLSFDAEAAGRSVEGLSGQGGFGLYPQFTLANAFTDKLPERTGKLELPAQGAGYKFFASLDHSAGGDEIPLTTWACPFPYDIENLTKHPIIGVEEVLLKSSRHLVVPEIASFAQAGMARYGWQALVVDSTSEGGLFVYNHLRSLNLPVVKMIYNAKITDSLPPNKELALQYLQRILTLGLEVQIDEDGWVTASPEQGIAFGGLRLPTAWRRTWRQLATLKRFDAHLTQDRAMCQAMLAWLVWRLYASAQRTKPRKFNVMAQRRREYALGGMRR